jgi:hypothetical protein
VQQQQHRVLKKPIRPVLLQMPSSPEAACCSGYAQLAQTRLRTATPPTLSGTPSSPPTMTWKQATTSSNWDPRRAASLPPSRTRSASPAQHARAGFRHTKDDVDLTSSKSSRALRQNTTETAMRGCSTGHGHAPSPVQYQVTAPSPEVLKSPEPGCQSPLPGTGSYYGRGRFAPPLSSPETLGL